MQVAAIIIDKPDIIKDDILNIKSRYNLHDKEIIFVSNHQFIADRIRSYSFKSKTVAEVLNYDDIQSGDEWAKRIALNWYKDQSGCDRSIFNGISLGLLSENNILFNLLIPRIRVIATIFSLLKYHYDLILLDDKLPSSYKIAACFKNVKIINIPYISVPPIIKSQESALCLPRKDLKVLVKIFIANIVNAINYGQRKKGKNILFSLSNSMASFLTYLFNQNLLVNSFFYYDNEIIWKLLKTVFNRKLFFLMKNYDTTNGSKTRNSCKYEFGRNDIYIYNELDFRETFIPLLRNYADVNWDHYKADIVFYEKQLLKNKIVFICVYADTPYFERMLCLVGKKNGIKTCVAQHGLKDYPNDRDMEVADVIMVWSRKVIDDYLSLKRLRSTVFVSGNPLFEMILNTERSVKKTRRILIVSNSFYNLSLHSQYSSQEIFLKKTIEFAKKKYPDYSILFRPHPGENIEIYQNFIFPNLLNHNIEMSVGSLDEALNKCDIVFCANSTVGIEAYLYGKEVFVFNLTGRRFVYPFNEADPIVKSIHPDIVPTKINLSESQVNEFAREANSRILKFFQEVIEPNVR